MMPHYDVIKNPIKDKRDIILKQTDTLDVLKNLDDGTEGNDTLSSNKKQFVKIINIGNNTIKKPPLKRNGNFFILLMIKLVLIILIFF